MDIFITNSSGLPIIGVVSHLRSLTLLKLIVLSYFYRMSCNFLTKLDQSLQVWPGHTAFPDFTNPQTQTYWEEQIQGFHSTILFDGLWIDMNEPSNFVNGSTEGCPKSPLNSPPFLPGIC